MRPLCFVSIAIAMFYSIKKFATKMVNSRNSTSKNNRIKSLKIKILKVTAKVMILIPLILVLPANENIAFTCR